jgi:hypothetical protein
MTSNYRQNGIASTVTGKELGDENQITVIRKITKYEELVFDNVEQFNEWKNLSDPHHEDWDDNIEKFNKFNSNHFVDIWYDTEEISPTEYVALKGDQTIGTDDWIYTGIFNESCEVYDLNHMEVIEYQEFSI